MNPIFLFMIIATAVAQDQCFGQGQQQGGCCAPQPVVIQLSCGNNGAPLNPPPTNPVPSPHPPPVEDHTEWPQEEAEPPAEYFTTESSQWNTEQPIEEEESVTEMYAYEQMENICEFDWQGNPITHPPGGWPQGFKMFTDNNGPVPIAPHEYPVPPPEWDGTVDTLGFPMPKRGTAHYNMLMCWPIIIHT